MSFTAWVLCSLAHLYELDSGGAGSQGSKVGTGAVGRGRDDHCQRWPRPGRACSGCGLLL